MQNPPLHANLARTLRMKASNRKSRKQTRKMARWNFNKAPKGK